MRDLFKKNWPVVALIFLVGFACYHNCLHNEMFWDDDDFILKNRYIRDWRYFPQFFQENLVAGGYLVSNYWRPLLLTVFASAWSIWHEWLPGWHMLNITFHSMDGILLFFLLGRLFADRILALVVSLIFVAHPVHNEAIVYVNSLGDSLATFFVLSSLLLFARFRQSGKAAYASRNFWFSLLCFPMAIMSKETGFVLCGLLPLMDFLLLQKTGPFKGRMVRCLSCVWPYLILAVVYVVMRGTVLNFANSFNFYNEQNEFTTQIHLRLLTFFKAVTQYAGFLFIPYELRVERQMPFAYSLWQWDVLLGAAIVAAMVAAIFKYWRTLPVISFGFGWFFIAIAPASNVLVPINAVLYEHFLYMPMIGIVLVVAYGALWLASRYKLSKPALIGLIALLVLYCGININRNKDWHTAIGFYEQLVRYAPSYRVINNLGMEYADKGFTGPAEYWYKKAIDMDPTNAVAYHNIAGTYRDTGRLALAEQHFKKAIELSPRFIFSYRALADLYFRTGNYEEARKYLLVLVNFDPQDRSARNVLQETENILRQRDAPAK
jgi:protein O-mannosyl-transferase